MDLPNLEHIQTARARNSKLVHTTPIFGSKTLSDSFGCTFYFKAENFQKTGSFKVRGVLNRFAGLSQAEQEKGLITVSAGNHASALAWAARSAQVAATVVMPTAASSAKVGAAKGYGAEVILFGNSSVEAFEEMQRIQSARQLTLVHPFDHPQIIAGTGTIGLELVEQIPDIDTVVVPIGGGGLIAGIAIAIKNLIPTASVIGVEPIGAAAMFQSLRVGSPVRLEQTDTIADGLAAPFAGELTLKAVQQYVDDLVLVNDSDIKQAMTFLLERCKLLVEPAGAAGLAAVFANKITLRPNSKIVIILSGGNVDLLRLSEFITLSPAIAS